MNVLSKTAALAAVVLVSLVAVAFAQEDGYSTVFEGAAGDGEVESAIAVKVAHRDRRAAVDHIVRGSAKAAIPFAYQDGHRAEPAVGDDEVGMAVAIEIRHCHA